MSLNDQKPNADEIIEQFGGIRPLAARLGVPFTTVQGWKKRNSIPDQHWKNIKILLDQGVANDDAPALDEEAHSADAPPPKTMIEKKSPLPEKNVVRGYSLGQAILVTSISVVVSVAFLVLLFGADFIVSNPNDRLAALENKIAQPQESFGARQLASLQETINNRVMPQLNEMQAVMGSIGNPQTLAELSTNIKTLQETTEGQAMLKAAMGELQSIVFGLKGDVKSLDVAMAQAQKENGALAETIGKVSTTDLTAAAMLLALNQFRTSLDRQEPLTGDIALLKSVINPDENPELAASIERLEPLAASGVMSPEGLNQELGHLANDIVEAHLNGSNASFQDIAQARFQQIFDVRKDGVPVLGTDEQKLVAKAQAQLKAGDVAAAKATLEQLPGPSRAVAEPVIGKAQQYMLAHQVESEITRFFAQSLQGLRHGGGSALYNPVTPYIPPSLTPSSPPKTGIAPVTPDEASDVVSGVKSPPAAPKKADTLLDKPVDQPDGAQPSPPAPSL